MTLTNRIDPHPERHIPKEIYGNQAKGGPRSATSALAVREDLHHVINLLALTRYQLAKLLGCPHDWYVYRWMSGAALPSPVYLQRMLRLTLMKHGELAVSLIREIDWVNSSITWKNGVITHIDHYLPDDPPKPNQRAIKTPGGDRWLKELPEHRATPDLYRYVL